MILVVNDVKRLTAAGGLQRAWSVIRGINRAVFGGEGEDGNRESNDKNNMRLSAAYYQNLRIT